MTQVSELLALKIENVLLKLDAVVATHRRFEEEKNELLKQAAAEVGAAADSSYNMQTRTFSQKDGPKPLSTEQRRQRKRVA